MYGPRAKLGFLVPSTQHEHGRFIQSWNLLSYAGDPVPIWLYCKYEHTALQLGRPLAASIRECTLTAPDDYGRFGFPVTVGCR